MPGPQNLNDDFAAVIRDLAQPVDENDRLRVGVASAVRLVEGCDHAGVTIVERSGLSTPAASDDIVQEGDRLQYELDEGPCLETVRTHSMVLSQDLLGDPRWPRWSQRVSSELGIRSMLALLLYTHKGSFGALNLYGDRAGGFSEDDLEVAQTLAAHIAVVFRDAREIKHQGRAVVNRTVIGQAEGIVMERFGVSADQAFAFLSRMSQQQNRRLVLLAADLVESRLVPGLDGNGAAAGRSVIDGPPPA